MTQDEIIIEVWNFLSSKGINDKVTSSIMGNIYAESGFDPNMVEVGSGIGFGLCQWSFERRTQLEAYGTSLQHQLNFLWSELSGEDLSITGANFQWINKPNYISHTNFMEGNGSIEELTAGFCFCWERPDESVAHLDVRIEHAYIYYERFNGTTPPHPSDGYKLTKRYIFGQEDSLFGRKFTSLSDTFKLVSTLGDMVIINDGKKNIKTYKKYLKKS